MFSIKAKILSSLSETYTHDPLKAHVRNSAAWPTDAAYWSVLHKDRKAL